MSDDADERAAEGEPDGGSDRFKHLPEPIKLEDTVESQETEPARDPKGGQNTERDFMIRWSGGGA